MELGKGYSKRNLWLMLKFYETQKMQTLSAQLSWSHYCELVSINDSIKFDYYKNISIKQNLSVRQLRERIKNNEYERLPEGTKNKLIVREETKVDDFIKNPIIIKNNSNYEIISEKILQKLILEDIPSFLDELGIGFTFIKNEYKIKIGDRYNFIDLLLYNIKYKCYCVVELKITELNKRDIGQIQIYMNYVDKHLKTIEEGNTIGIIIVKKNNKFIMEYCSDKRILSKEYQIV